MIGQAMSQMLSGVGSARQSLQYADQQQSLAAEQNIRMNVRYGYALLGMRNVAAPRPAPSRLLTLLDEIAAERDMIAALGSYDRYAKHMAA